MAQLNLKSKFLLKSKSSLPFRECIDSSKNSNSKVKLLMREYVEKKLYLNDGYYSNSNNFFSNENSQSARTITPIGRLEKPLKFIDMRGIKDYADELNIKYPKSTWLTCSELLRPYFGYALGNYILTNHLKSESKKGIKIIEIGCGMGGAIDSILEYFKNFSMKTYKEVEYVGLEMTNILCESTDKLLKDKHPDLYKNEQLTVLNQSLYNFNSFDLDYICEDECYILAFNFIDSIGHDRVMFEKSFESVFNKELLKFNQFKKYDSNKHDENYFSSLDAESGSHLDNFSNYKSFLNNFLNKNKNLVKEAHVNLSYESENDFSGRGIQIFEPINDEIIKEMLFYYLMPTDEKNLILGDEFLQYEKNRLLKYEDWFIKFLRLIYDKINILNSNQFVWLPSEAIKFFKTINKQFPNHKLILLDFDFLTPKIFKNDYKGKNSPVVYSIKNDSYDSITHSSIFDNYSSPVNIYYPVDFQLLQTMYRIITRKRSTINKFKYLMTEYSMAEWCETKSGFNPLVDTHHNLSFLLTI